MSQDQLLGLPLPVMLALAAMVVLLAVLGRVALSLRRRAPVRQGLYLAWDARRAMGDETHHFRLARLSIEPIDDRDMRR